MSGEGSFGLSTTEKFFGLIIMVVGVITLYYTLTSMDTLLSFTGLFGFLSVVLVILGLVLMTAKPE
jgi:succinate-acetate transporter protein